MTAPKNLRLQINMPHGHEPGWAPKEIGLYIDSTLGVRAERALPSCGAPEIKGSKAVATVTGDDIKSVTLNYALPGTAVNNREWHTVPAKVEKGLVTAEAPPQGTDMFFFAITDQRDAMISSEVVFAQH